MLTQIFIKGGGCQPEYTKIASHSFGFTGDFFRGAQVIDQLYFAGDYDPATGDGLYPVWSATKYDFGEGYVAGSLGIKDTEKTAGIALPINLVPNDKITLSGTAYYSYYQDWIDSGFTSVTLIVGVYYFNCSDEQPRLFTFIPVTLTDFDEFGTACFNAEVTLGSSFNFHETRIVIGYNTYATGDAVTPASPTILTVSHTLDIERPCQVDITNYIIKNCCEPIITELVNIPGLVVGNFHVDNEGNCWEVMEVSNDVTNFTRTFTDIYTTCLECQDANPCPSNLKIGSCCVSGQEFVTGSLPGLVVGDTFVDNYGLCWTVEDETGAPISEESITVVSIIEGDCVACLTANPCPNFYRVKSCCTSISGTIAVPDVLNTGDSFVDAQGLCWNVGGPGTSLPTIYGIEVVTVYPFQGIGVVPTSCTLCTTANPCPTEYFITIRGCCDNDRIEVAQVPAASMIFNEGLIFPDSWGICWEVMSFSTTGVETYPIFDWLTSPAILTFGSCLQCVWRKFKGAPCITLYEVRACGALESTIVAIDGTVTIGGIYILYNNIIEDTCYEIIGFGYPTFNILYPLLNTIDGPFLICEECDLMNRNTTKTLEFSQCCGGPNIIVEYTGAWTVGFGGIAMVPLGIISEGPYTPTCVTLVGFSTATPTLYNQPNTIANYSDCVSCTDEYGCSD